LRDLRKWDLVALVVNSVIGAGIFGLPSRVFALAGTYSLIAYIAAAFAVLLIVLCFAEVSSRFSQTGGPYLYARASFGPFIGFQVGWLLWFGRVTSIASLANLFTGYASFFTPAAATEPWRSILIFVLLFPLTVTNVLGVRASKTFTNIITVAKVTPLCVFALAGLFFVDPQRYSFDSPSYGSFSQAALLLVFTFTGFEAVTVPTGEMRDPRRHLPFALLVGIIFVGSLYILVQTVSIGTLPGLASSQRPLADASRLFLGPAGALMIAIGALVSITGTQNASLFATPRLLFAMADNGELPRALASTNARYRTPAMAIIVTAVVSIALAIFSTFISALTISTVVRLIAYAITCVAVPLLRRNREAPPPAFVAPAGPVIAAVAVALSLWLLSNSPTTEMRMSILAVAIGWLIYLNPFGRGATLARSSQERV
jgi:amino acid transporter